MLENTPANLLADEESITYNCPEVDDMDQRTIDYVKEIQAELQTVGQEKQELQARIEKLERELKAARGMLALRERETSYLVA